MLELRYEREVRIGAPCGRVHEELSDLGQLLRYVPEAEDVAHADGDRRASLRTSLLDGPLSEPTDVVIELLDPVVSGGGVEITAEAPDLGLRCVATFDLIAAATDQTQLRCDATLTCDHERAERLRSQLLGALESHVDTITQDLAERVGQLARAEKAFESN